MGVFFVPKLAKLALVSASAARIAAKAYHAGKQIEKRITEFLYPQEEDVIVMKKSTFAAILVFFAAVAGALAAVYFYLRRRESELDEYEQLLFSEDFSHEEDSRTARACEGRSRRGRIKRRWDKKIKRPESCFAAWVRWTGVPAGRKSAALLGGMQALMARQTHLPGRILRLFF